jgi:histidinol-phosphatase (PHP family)
LGSVHWIGSWSFDSRAGVDREEWDRRDVDGVFAEYAALLRELAETGLCDVLAHPDLPKLFGHRPSSFTPLYDVIIESATGAQVAIEMNSNGWRKPVAAAYPAAALLERARAAGLPVTLASDAHYPERVGQRFDDLAALAVAAGYDEFLSFETRVPATHALPAVARK